jgi:hypothetical protein
VQVGKGRVVKITGIANKGRTATVLLRGSNKLVLEVRACAAQPGCGSAHQEPLLEGRNAAQPALVSERVASGGGGGVNARAAGQLCDRCSGAEPCAPAAAPWPTL